MIEQIKQIGYVYRQYLENKNESLDKITLLQKYDSGGDYEHIIDVDISTTVSAESRVSVTYRQYSKDIFHVGLSYLEGNVFVGAVLRGTKYLGSSKSINSDDNKKSVITKCLAFIEVDFDLVSEIQEKIDACIEEFTSKKDIEKKIVIAFKRDGKYPIEEFESKFMASFSDILRKTNKKGVCHLCGKEVKQLYETCGYKCYTNDKNIFNKTLTKLPYAVCDDCLTGILYGRHYINKNLSTWWHGSNVMFLPNEFNEKLCELFDNQNIFVMLKDREPYVFKQLGKMNSGIDILFYIPDKSSWKITQCISNINSTRYVELSKIGEKYKSHIKGNEKENDNIMTLFKVVYYMAGRIDVKKDDGKIDYKKFYSMNSTKSNLGIILNGAKIDRSQFFTNTMRIYEHNYKNGKKSMNTIHRVYNYLVDCGCLDKGWNVMSENNKDGGIVSEHEYKNINDLFNKNTVYFDNNEKKAWFMLGSLFKTASRMSDEYHNRDTKGEKSEKPQRSYAENGFFFGRKFDRSTFIYFTNLCTELSIKYQKFNIPYVKQAISDVHSLMASVHGNKPTISDDEAEYIFMWGMSQWYKNEKHDEDVEVNDNDESGDE